MKALPWLIGIVSLLCGAAAFEVSAGIRMDLERQVHILEQGESPPLAIGGAQYRIGVFTYEDPDRTGLGDALGKLVAHDVLLRTQARSLGVLMFTGGLAPSRPGGLSYFDKIEKVAAGQQVYLAVWGTIRRIGTELLIETYLQIPESTADRDLAAEVSIPAADQAPKKLTARLRPDRFAVQRYRIPADDTEEISLAAKRIGELRSEPRPNATVDAVLETGQLFFTVDRTADWIKLQVRGGPSGWVPLTEHCQGGCAPLLDATEFVSGLVRLVDAGEPPRLGPTLTTETLAVLEQLQALGYLKRGNKAAKAQAIASRWSGPDRMTGTDPATEIDRGQGIPPGGAAFANIGALAQVQLAMSKARANNQTPLLDPGVAEGIAFELAEASLYDPRNTEVLRNLKVLFDYAGDTERAELAGRLVRQE